MLSFSLLSCTSEPLTQNFTPQHTFPLLVRNTQAQHIIQGNTWNLHVKGSGFVWPNDGDVSEQSACFCSRQAVYLFDPFHSLVLEVPVFFPAHHYASLLSGRLHAACVWVENTDYFCCLTGNGCACLIVSAFVWLGLILQGCANSIAGRSHVCVYR